MGDVSFAVPVPVFISERHSRTHTFEGVRAAPAVLLEIRREKKRRKQRGKDIEEEASGRE